MGNALSRGIVALLPQAVFRSDDSTISRFNAPISEWNEAIKDKVC